MTSHFSGHKETEQPELEVSISTPKGDKTIKPNPWEIPKVNNYSVNEL